MFSRGADPEPLCAGGILGTVPHPEGAEQVADTQGQEAPGWGSELRHGVGSAVPRAVEESRTQQTLGASTACESDAIMRDPN